MKVGWWGLVLWTTKRFSGSTRHWKEGKATACLNPHSKPSWPHFLQENEYVNILSSTFDLLINCFLSRSELLELNCPCSVLIHARQSPAAFHYNLLLVHIAQASANTLCWLISDRYLVFWVFDWQAFVPNLPSKMCSMISCDVSWQQHRQHLRQAVW